jgi:hypothetical protein
VVRVGVHAAHRMSVRTLAAGRPRVVAPWIAEYWTLVWAQLLVAAASLWCT